ncbi:ATP-binding protein [Streptomyces sp. WAC05374]|uniref:ATP-binding protein n=1 Tax=unclassified Streptomyces TaxID=2593676 RepID=UPI000F88E1A8|nr:ATP-binding protein [Streptomyces sp. WAC05374]RST06010.1 ATP-binding protein [Streptomyces sp. WAC05374]TDF46967.1 ATP-binding protein [Streptomyces sp. WAC05374]TDF57222.1 ATP-binding protein [Streptomyces sp. WAC05374]TDF61325.1 ATP-binding protein [Streptomyces sp. WAC05374]
MGTTQQHPPSDLGPQAEGSGLAAGAALPAASAASTTPEVRSDMSGAASGAPPAGRRTRRLSLGSASGIVPLARDFTRQALYDWGWLPAATADRRAAAEDVLLVVSELVTNACLHAEGPEELRVSLDAKVLRLEVEDRGAGQPAPRQPHRAGRPGGHGMFIVQRLCLDWGVVRSTGMPGKTVWAELAAPA